MSLPSCNVAVGIYRFEPMVGTMCSPSPARLRASARRGSFESVPYRYFKSASLGLNPKLASNDSFLLFFEGVACFDFGLCLAILSFKVNVDPTIHFQWNAHFTEQLSNHGSFRRRVDPATANTISRFRDELPAAESIASVRLIESQAALAYWSAWRTLPINFPKKDLRRVPDHWRSFGARISPLTGSPRLSVNPPNAMLNYLYAVLESEARLAAVALGLDPGLGVLHADTANRDSLALDLLEPVRPQVDSYLLEWITKQTLRKEWFVEQANGNCRLTAALALQLSESAVAWGRAVAPIAEWVAQALWDSICKPPSELQKLPTRLTQRHRTEGRGKEVAPSAIPKAKIQRVCRGCGAATKRGRHCRKCAKEVSGQKLTELAKKGRIVTLDTAAQRKRSETQRGHEAAKREWRDSSSPNTIDYEKYDKEIRPSLASVTIAPIASTLGVSEPYAALIRAGRRRPHPRHWQMLAELGGVTR